jgi:hypothetical protein
VRRFKYEIIALSLGFVVMMSPWWLRNEMSIHQLSDPLKMLQTVQQGSYPDLMYEGRPDTYGNAYSYDPAVARIGTSWARLFADLGRKFAEHPIAMIRWYSIGKLGYFFNWSSAEGWGDMFTYPMLHSPWLTAPLYILIVSIMWGMHAPLIVCGLLGTVAAFLPATRRLFGGYRADALQFLALLHLFAIGVHVIGLPIGRYSVPFLPLTFLLGIFLPVWLFRLYQEHKRRDAPVVAAHD